jgi:hypothetical protein
MRNKRAFQDHLDSLARKSIAAIDDAINPPGREEYGIIMLMFGLRHDNTDVVCMSNGIGPDDMGRILAGAAKTVVDGNAVVDVILSGDDKN